MKNKNEKAAELLNPTFKKLSALKFVKTITDYSGPIAEFYDPMQSWLSEDVEFFLKEIKGKGRKILELGSGTGRIALPIAGRGHTVYAVDNAGDMQAILKRKLKGALAKRVIPVKASLVDARIDQKFDYAIMGLNTIFGLAEEEDRLAAFRNIAAHLKPGGYFYVDTMLPSRGLLVNRPGMYSLYTLEDKKGNSCINVSFCRYNVKTQVSVLNLLNIVVDKKGRAKFYITPSKEYIPGLGELQVLLRSSGFKVAKIYSDYKGTELNPADLKDDGQEIVIKAQKL